MRVKNIETAWMLVGALLIGGGISLLIQNQYTEVTAGDSATAVIESLSEAIASKSTQPSLSHKTASGESEESDCITVIGVPYAGILEIPELDLVLPVLTECTAINLESAPCRYTGYAAENNLVIAGHNYTSHFGELHKLVSGDMICFTDAYNRCYYYEVKRIETLAPDDIQEMTAGEYALTLFTCTYGGRNRVVVRCS